jgi:N-acetylglucosaminyl-diphospho-decaprenol L-rhamnosyltransferase
MLKRFCFAGSGAGVVVKVLAVIVNHKRPELVLQGLKSLQAELAAIGGGCRAIVTDASGDGSDELIERGIREQGWGDWVTLLRLDKNGGYGYANNQAIRHALAGADLPEFFYLLNPDAYVYPGAVRELLQCMLERPDVGLCGSQQEQPDGSINRAAFRFPGVRSELIQGSRLGILKRVFPDAEIAPPPPEQPAAIDWLSGASLLVRRSVFESVGLFDETFFLYYEETDLCLRARRAGWLCWYVPASRVVHLEGQSTGVTDTRSAPKRLPRYWFESRQHYFMKNHGPWKKHLADVAWTLGFVSWRARRRFQGKTDDDPPHLLSDFVRFNFLHG